MVYTIDRGLPGPLLSSDEDADGNIQLSKFLRRRRLNTSHLQSVVETGAGPDVNYILFRGPSNVRKLTAYERVCLKSFFWGPDGEDELMHHNRDDTDLDAYVDSFDIPSHCRTFRSVSYNTSSRPYPCKATSSNLERSNQSRSTSFVCFERSTMVNGRQSHFGEVLFFFTINLPEGCPCVGRPIGQAAPQPNLRVAEKERGPVRESRENELLLAYVRHFPIQRDGRLLYRGGDGRLLVIMARDIHELIGLLNKGNRQYLVRKHTALF